MNHIILGGGCFWCLEAVFKQFKGIVKIAPGYTAGEMIDPDYKSVCSGSTGHAEVIKIEYDETKVTLEDILTIFFASHDPTTLNRQGNDVGTQYRSIILYDNEAELDLINQVKTKASEWWPNPIVTQIIESTKFYPAEAYHHDYYTKNPSQGYCMYVVNPKIQKAKAKFSSLVN